MGYFPPTAQRDIDRAFQTALDNEPLPFGEGVAAVREDVLLTGRTDSLSYQFKDKATRTLRALTDRTGEQFAIPDGTWSNRQTDAMLTLIAGREDAIKALRSDEAGPPDLRLQTRAELEQGVRETVAEARSRAGRAGLGASLVGGLAGAIPDPVNLALLPLGVFSAEGILARMGVEAAIGAGSQALVEAASLPAKDAGGVTPSATEAAANIALTGVFGAGLAGAFHGAGLVARRAGLLADYRAKVEAGTIVETREMQAAADAIQDALDTIPPAATPEAEGAYLEGVVAASDVLRAESPGEEAAALARMEAAGAKAVEPVATEPPPLSASEHLTQMRAALAEEEKAAAAIREPRERRRQTLLAEIRRRGGMSFPTNFVRKGQLGQTGLLTAIRRNGMGIDQWHSAMIEEGLIPEGTELGEFFDMLSSGTKTMEAQQAAEELDYSKFSGVYTLTSEIDAFEKARREIVGSEGLGPEPSADDVLYYMADPDGYIRKLEASYMDAAVSREVESPLPPVVEPEIDAPPVAAAELDPEEAMFRAAIEADPELSAAYVGDNGQVVTGRASDLVARLDEQRTTFQQIRDCLVGGLTNAVK